MSTPYLTLTNTLGILLSMCKNGMLGLYMPDITAHAVEHGCETSCSENGTGRDASRK